MAVDDRLAVDQERYFYDADSLEEATREFERVFGIDSAALYDAYTANELPPNVPRFHAHVWASFVEDIRRLRDHDAEDTLGRVRRAFAHA